MSVHTLEAARSLVQQMASATIHGDRDRPVDLITEWLEEGGPAAIPPLVACDLMLYVHRRWCQATGFDPVAAWRVMMLDAESARYVLRDPPD